VNALVLGLILLFWFFAGYKIYGSWIEKKLVAPDDSKVTPAHELRDGVDYSPAKTPVLFGHHFSSIAGAGPIVGPLLGVLYFGWLAAVLWIAVGSIFMGAVHDYLTLMASVRNRGKSIAEITEGSLGRRSRVIFSVFLWLSLVLVVAVFAVITASTFISKPEIVIPTFGLIFVAMLFGWMVYRKGVPLLLGTLSSLGLVAVLLYLGDHLPIELPETVLGLSAFAFWFFVLMIYALVASVLPVWFLLQPRDYLSSWLLFLGLGLGYLGLVFAHPQLDAPALVGFTSKEGPLWPMLFVIIACGAISGFHSLVAGGTTSKQLDKESKGKQIGYGAMVVEAVLAALVITIAAGALKWDPAGGRSEFGLQWLMGEGGGPIVAFATGFGRMTSAVPGFNFIVGVYFGMIMLNAFVITTLDTATRLGRFILTELVGEKLPAFNNRWLATVVTIIFVAYFGAGGGYKIIWPVFGAANQLVAALALIVISAYLVGLRKPRLYTLLPAIFMGLTTIGALVYQGYNFFSQRLYVLAVTSVVLVLLALFIMLEARSVFSWRSPAR
jgi:carbon starvation protein